MSKILEEIKGVLGEQAAPRTGESPADYRARLVRLLSDVPEDKWAKLSTDAQKWTNDGVDALTAKNPVADFPDAAPAAPAAAPAAQGAAPSEPAAAPAAAPTTTEAAPAATDTGGKRRGGSAYLRQLTVNDPPANNAEDKEHFKRLLSQTHEAGYTISENSAYIVYYEVVHTMKLLADAGKLK